MHCNSLDISSYVAWVNKRKTINNSSHQKNNKKFLQICHHDGQSSKGIVSRFHGRTTKQLAFAR